MLVSLQRGRVSYEKKHTLEDWPEILANMGAFLPDVRRVYGYDGHDWVRDRVVRWEDILENEVLIRNSAVRNDEKSHLKNGSRERKLPVTRALPRLIDKIASGSEVKFLVTMKSMRGFNIDSLGSYYLLKACLDAGLRGLVKAG